MNFGRDYEAAHGVERGLYAIAIALTDVAYQIRSLGNGDAASPMGAIEALSVQIREGLDGIAMAMPRGD